MASTLQLSRIAPLLDRGEFKIAIMAGADYIVVGRPITETKDPLGAAKKIIKEMES